MFLRLDPLQKRYVLDMDCLREHVDRVHLQGPVPQAGKLQARRGGKARLPHPSFAAKQKDSHTLLQFYRSCGTRSSTRSSSAPGRAV